MKSKRFALIIGILIFSVAPFQDISAVENAANPGYSCKGAIRDGALTDDYEYTIGSDSVLKKSGDFLLMIKGNLTAETVLVRNGRALVPIRAVADAYGLRPEWDSQSRTVTMMVDGKVIRLKANSNIAAVNGDEILLDVPTEIVSGRLYVPLWFIADFMDKAFGYLPAYSYRPMDTLDTLSVTNVGIAYNPVVWIDESGVKNTIEETQIWLKQELSKALENQRDFLKTPDLEYYKDMDKAFIQINLDKAEQRINKLRYIGQLGRYEIFAGPYIILADSEEKKIYFYQVAHALGAICEIDINKAESFSSMYLFD